MRRQEAQFRWTLSLRDVGGSRIVPRAVTAFTVHQESADDGVLPGDFNADWLSRERERQPDF
jgi:hypothetical protein